MYRIGADDGTIQSSALSISVDYDSSDSDEVSDNLPSEDNRSLSDSMTPEQPKSSSREISEIKEESYPAKTFECVEIPQKILFSSSKKKYKKSKHAAKPAV
jgi:hypothetical protein